MAINIKSEQSDIIRTNYAVFAERLRYCAKKVGNAKKLSTLTNIPASTISDYLSEKTEPSREKLITIAEAANVSIAWLVTGEGSIEPGGTTESDFAVLPLFTPTGEPRIIKGSAHFSYNKEWLVQGGFNLKDLATAIIINDTMEPTAPFNATAIVDRSKTTPANGLFLLSINDWIEVRRLHLLTDGKVSVICDNAKYPSFDAEKESLTIAGRVVAFVHLMRA